LLKKTARDGKTLLWVQQCGSDWIIERSRRADCGHTQDETLVCAFGSVPIWAPTYAAAMRLAEHCDPMPRSPVAGYWASVGNIDVC
jgi:hypothetical protein